MNDGSRRLDWVAAALVLEDRVAEPERRIEFSERLLTHGGSGQTATVEDDHAR